MAIPFLQSLAQSFADRYADLSGHLFIFPNRRAGTFFLKNLRNCIGGKTVLLPRVTTMTDFVEEMCGGVVAGRIELLFVLYDAYVALLRERDVKTIPEFDSFRRWGETALSDFNEVDMHDANADEIFKNVKDVKEISSNFLTEEQMKVMEEFFGQSVDPHEAAEGFWRNFEKGSEDEKASKLKNRFLLIWQVLGPLYHSLHRELSKRGLFTSGGAYRHVADLLERKGADVLDARRVVMVGFNALTAAERRIFDALAAMEIKEDPTTGFDPADDTFASFFWDVTGPVIMDKSSAAGRYVNFGMSRWPSPQWAERYLAASSTLEMPSDIKVISVPSNSLQTKVISSVLEEMAKNLPQSDFTDAKVAVVLPDEGLLIPMLYSVPQEIENINITMGYPLRLTSIYTFVSLLRRLQSSRRKAKNGQPGYYYKDLMLFLSHPYCHLLFKKKVSVAKEWIMKYHKTIVTMEDLSEVDNECFAPMTPLGDNAGAKETAVWLDSILSAVADALSETESSSPKSAVETANVNVYRLALSRLVDAIDEYGVEMQWRTFLTLTDRLIAPETVNFEGQPLRGLQVMGLLETRALDFERIIIPSLNERILPMRRRPRTFISDSLRKAYGLPPVNYAESLFAYYFYRMISRAKQVVLLYDGRSSEGARSGDVSRYVLQLKYLYVRGRMKMESLSFEMSKSELSASEIAKTQEIMDMMKSFYSEGNDARNLSATALSGYAACQIRFYFENVLRIKTDEEAKDYIDSMTQGSVIHDVMQNLYLPPSMQKIFLKRPQVVDSRLINSRIGNVRLIDHLIKRAINKHHLHLDEKDLDTPLEGSCKFVARAIRNQVLGILRFDLSQAPILLYGVEIDGNVLLRMPDGREINMRYAIDRIDSPKGAVDSNGVPILRIVDYKTGASHCTADSMRVVFEGDYHGKNILQLWLYANLFDALPDKYVNSKERQSLELFNRDIDAASRPYILEIYDVGMMSGKKHTLPKIEGEVQTDNRAHNAEFLENLQQMLVEMFDINAPFRPSQDPANCAICPFRSICLRKNS